MFAHPASTKPVARAPDAHSNPNPRGFSSFTWFLPDPARKTMNGDASGAVPCATVLDFRLT
ncbi:hypothetical protein GCM10027262_22860 [Nocardia tengchongensis]